jgi:RNA polymerase sigma-70 factor, ECF subfamily
MEGPRPSMTVVLVETVERIETCPVEGAAARIRGGDRGAFLELYEQYAGRLCRFGEGYCGNAERAAEAVQQAFLDLFARPEQFDPARGSVQALLFGMVRNRLRTARREYREGGLEEDTPADTDLLAGLDRDRRIAAVREAIGELPERYREVILLCEIEECSYEETAQSLDIPVGTVRSRLSRAKGMLKTKLRRYGGHDAL